jgi:hypothetical protein
LLCKVFSGDIIRIAQSPGMMGAPIVASAQNRPDNFMLCVAQSLSLVRILYFKEWNKKPERPNTQKQL